MTGTSSADRVTKLVRLCLIMTVTTGISLVSTASAVKASTSSKTTAIATDAWGVVIPVVPLNEPYLSEPRVVGYAEECTRRAFSHDFLHYSQTMSGAQECFTPNAADKYAQSMQGYFKLMDERRMNMAVVVRRPPVVVRAYDLGGVIHWDVQVEVDISFEGRSERIPATKNRIDMTLRRMPLEAAVRGVAIDRFSVGPAS